MKKAPVKAQSKVHELPALSLLSFHRCCCVGEKQKYQCLSPRRSSHNFSRTATIFTMFGGGVKLYFPG